MILISLAQLFPHAPHSLTIEESLIDLVRQSGCLIRCAVPLFFSLLLGALPCFAPSFRRLWLVEEHSVAQTLVLSAVPLEYLRLVLFADATTFKPKLLEE